MSFDHFLATFGGVGGAVAVLGIIVKIWPGTVQRFADSIFNHADPTRLKKDSPLAKHFEHTDELTTRQARIIDTLTELQVDAISNTILGLAHMGGDQSTQIAEQVTKLEKLDTNSWALAFAQQYIADHAKTAGETHTDTREEQP